MTSVREELDLTLRSPSVSGHNGRASSASMGDRPEETEDIPDGGYGWVIVFACSAITFFSVGIPYTWGVFQVRLAADGVATNSSLAFAGSAATAFVSLAAITNTKIIRAFGTRIAAVIGSTLMGLAQILTSWSNHNFPALFITNGIIGGLGSCSSLPSQYFKKRRGLANGLVVAGGGLGGAALSISMNALLGKIGLAWTFRVLGAFTLLVTVPASLLIRERTRRGTASIEWFYFKDAKFVLLFLGSGIATFPILVPPFFIPLYATSLGISSGTASVLLAAFNLSSAAGRVAFGSLSDFLGPITSLILALMSSAVSILAIWPFSSSLAPLAVFIVCSGLGNGGFFSTMPSIVGHLYGPARVPVAYAMIVTAWAAGYILGAPVAGWILERYGGSEAGRLAFRPAMYYAGSMALGSTGLVMGMRHIVSPKLLSFA